MDLIHLISTATESLQAMIAQTADAPGVSMIVAQRISEVRHSFTADEKNILVASLEAPPQPASEPVAESAEVDPDVEKHHHKKHKEH